MTGLTIGSLTPDFEYFIRMKIQSNFSHTINGLLWFDLPLGLLLTFVFHNLVRDSLFDNLPKILKLRIVKYKNFDWNKYFKAHWLVTTISILIGAASHIFWDSFTHENGYFVQTFPALLNTVKFFGRQILVMKILQHLSTFLGGIVIVFTLFKLSPDKNVTGQLNFKYWIILTMLTMTIIAIRLLSGLDYKLFGHVIITAISAGLISLTLTPWLTKLKV